MLAVRRRKYVPRCPAVLYIIIIPISCVCRCEALRSCPRCPAVLYIMIIPISCLSVGVKYVPRCPSVLYIIIIPISCLSVGVKRCDRALRCGSGYALYN